MLCILVGVLVLGCGFADSSFAGAEVTVEAQPADVAIQSMPVASETSPVLQAVLVSELLPEALADFVCARGLDRPIGDLSAEAAEQLPNQMVSYDVALELLRPEVIHWVGECVVFERANPYTRLVAVTYVVVDVDGQSLEIPMGEEVPFGVEVINGMVLNVGLGSVEGMTTGGEAITPLLPGHLLATRKCAETCSITCGTGKAACCYVDGKACARCTCVADPPGTCPNDTTGGTSCSVSTDAAHTHAALN
ncbi:MAG: hypothetical protein KAV82_15490 [Phycisphaerae bacterium]|nr:hypothetical protein [Phycisphaerae bacterium]